MTDLELDQLISEAKQLLGDEPKKMNADDIHIDFEKFYGEIPPDDIATATSDTDETILFKPLTAYEQSRPEYQTARREIYAQEREKKRKEREEEMLAREAHTEKLLRKLDGEKKSKKKGILSADIPNQHEYAEWLYAQGDDEQTRMQREMLERKQEPVKVKKPRKKINLKPLVSLICILAALAAVVFVLPQAPKAEGSLARKAGTATILLAGTDAGGYRTDTMMLMNFSRTKGAISLVSIPRDTFVYGDYYVPKMNSAYGAQNGGEAGMEELMARVEEVVGFRPDGYVLVSLESFQALVDMMGGVAFDVPQPMNYEDPAQGLSIHLAAGYQQLDGKSAMQLVRFRSGYADADLGRVSVQRDFVMTAMKQWATPANLLRLPSAIGLLCDSVQTDLSALNLIWLAQSAAMCADSVHSATLPGTPTMIAGGSYYVLDAEGVAEAVNAYCNPYKEGVHAEDLYIRAG